MSRYFIVKVPSNPLELFGNEYSLKGAEVKLADIAKDMQVQNKGLHVSEVDEHGFVTVREPSSNEYMLTIVMREELLDQPIKVLSSMIRTVGYETASGELVVRFTNGNAYRYEGVPTEVFFKILTAASSGQMFNALVKGKFECRRTE